MTAQAMTSPLRVAVVGAGWAGLAAAVEATLQGHAVTLFEMAGAPGGRARRAGIDDAGFAFDNGQHIMIGAYRECLRLMRAVGVDPESTVLRTPLRMVDAQGRGLVLPQGRPLPAFARGLLAATHWPAGERLRLAAAAVGWVLSGFRCPTDWTVDRLARSLGPRVRTELIDPLCVAALNTPSDRASAAVFLRVLHDALFSAPGASDLLLPRLDLGRLWPEPACDWLARQGVVLRWRTRVGSLDRAGAGWQVNGEAFDAVVLATSASEAARLAAPHAPAWAATAAAMRYEPIVTVWLRCPQVRLPQPLLTLSADDTSPAQFVFDLGQLHAGQPAAQGVLAFVISGAGTWVAHGAEATQAAVMAQARSQLGPLLGSDTPLLHSVAERRATFACTPALRRADGRIAARLWAAGDHVDGPYPATLEGAVRSGVAAARALRV